MIKSLTTEKIHIEVAPLTCSDLLYVDIELDIVDNKVVDHTIVKISSGFYNGVEIEKDQREITDFKPETIEEIEEIIKFHKLEREQKG